MAKQGDIPTEGHIEEIESMGGKNKTITHVLTSLKSYIMTPYFVPHFCGSLISWPCLTLV